MKFKATFILSVVFVALLVFVLFFLPEKGGEEKAEYLVQREAGDLETITLKRPDGVLSFRRDGKGEWLITEPLEAGADSYEVNRLAEELSSLKMERVVEPEPASLDEYEIPKQEVVLRFKGESEPVRVLVGRENPLDGTLFARKEGDKRVVLLSSSLKIMLEKRLMDFRQKDIFRFEVQEAGSLSLRAGDTRWKASKKDNEWHLEEPVSALAQKYKVEGLLNTLSGLRAKEFISEDKTEKVLEELGLNEPEVEVNISLPKDGQNITFSLHQKDETVYATTSLSTKVVSAENLALAELGKKPDDLREKRVTLFSSWQADKLSLKKNGLAMTLAKNMEDGWSFTHGGQGEADPGKVETFIRLVSSLEAVEFIDHPAALSSYGLDPPRREIRIWTKGDDEKILEVTLLVGEEDPEEKEVVVRNPRFKSLFRVSSEFLAEFPKEPLDWKKQELKEGK